MLGSSVSAVVGLTTTYAAILLDAVPRDMIGGNLALKLTDIVTAVSVTWYLAADAIGDEPLTPVRTADTIVGATGGKGGIASSLDGIVLHAWATGPQIWVIAKLNAGTANATARLSWRQL